MEEPSEPSATRADYESTPLNRAEYIAAVVHLYRGELYRANSWRIRLDNTTHWAVLTVAGLLSLSFGDTLHSHWVLLMGLILIGVFHGFEARRFRLFDIWRSRVRKIEENFYGPILRRDPVSPERGWGNLVAADLLRPHFRIGRFAALRARFVRNYWAIYAILLLAWGAKVLVHPGEVHTWADLRAHLATGILPWWAPLVYVGAFLTACALLVKLAPKSPEGERDKYWGEDTEQLDLIDV